VDQEIEGRRSNQQTRCRREKRPLERTRPNNTQRLISTTRKKAPETNIRSSAKQGATEKKDRETRVGLLTGQACL